MTEQQLYDLIANLKSQKLDIDKIILSYKDYNAVVNSLTLPSCPQFKLMGTTVTFNHYVPDSTIGYELANRDSVNNHQLLLDEVNRLNGVVDKLQSICQHDVTSTSQRSGSPMVCSKCGYEHAGKFIHN